MKIDNIEEKMNIRKYKNLKTKKKKEKTSKAITILQIHYKK